MDRDSVVRHLRAWSDGVDPATGTPLRPDHPAQQSDVLRVVFATLALLEREVPGPEGVAAAHPVRTGPRNAGRPWSAADDEALAAAHDEGASVEVLAARMERTRGAITARLARLGKIELPPGMRLRGGVS